MKVRITKPDGTVVECEGTAEECARLMGPAPVFVPYIAPTYPWWTEIPWWQSPTYTVVGYTDAPGTAATQAVIGDPPVTTFSWTGASS